MAKERATAGEAAKALANGQPLPEGWTLNWGHSPILMTVEEREAFDTTGEVPKDANRRVNTINRAMGVTVSDDDDGDEPVVPAEGRSPVNATVAGVDTATNAGATDSRGRNTPTSGRGSNLPTSS